MRELFLVSSESTETSLVLRAEDGEQFFVAVDDVLRSALTGATPPPDDEPEGTPDPHPAPETTFDDAPAGTEAIEVAEVTEPEPVRVPSSLEERGLPTPDPRLTAPLTLRPREIQERIRAGASTAELADEMGVLESRVEAFAHPVLLERERIAQLARQAHPVREDGPAKLTLWEVLATAFAARGHNLADAEWDAYREPGGPWVVRVSWTAGLSENSAEWTYHHHSTSSSTAEARNAVAADLTDPDFVQPVRTLTSVGRGARYAEDITDDDDRYDDVEEQDEEREELDDKATDIDDEVPEEDAEREVAGDDEDPDAQQKPPAKRRRKAVTPHWEDVLLGVRANTKRPRN